MVLAAGLLARPQWLHEVGQLLVPAPGPHVGRRLVLTGIVTRFPSVCRSSDRVFAGVSGDRPSVRCLDGQRNRLTPSSVVDRNQIFQQVGGCMGLSPQPLLSWGGAALGPSD